MTPPVRVTIPSRMRVAIECGHVGLLAAVALALVAAALVLPACDDERPVGEVPERWHEVARCDIDSRTARGSYSRAFRLSGAPVLVVASAKYDDRGATPGFFGGFLLMSSKPPSADHRTYAIGVRLKPDSGVSQGWELDGSVDEAVTPDEYVLHWLGSRAVLQVIVYQRED